MKSIGLEGVPFFLEKCPLLVFGWFQQDSLWKETPLSCFNLRRRQTSQSKERRATDQSKTNFYTKRSIFPLKAVLKSKNLQFTTNFYSNKLQGSLLLIEVAVQIWFFYIRFGLSILGLQWKVFFWVILWWLRCATHLELLEPKTKTEGNMILQWSREAGYGQFMWDTISHISIPSRLTTAQLSTALFSLLIILIFSRLNLCCLEMSNVASSQFPLKRDGLVARWKADSTICSHLTH